MSLPAKAVLCPKKGEEQVLLPESGEKTTQDRMHSLLSGYRGPRYAKLAGLRSKMSPLCTWLRPGQATRSVPRLLLKLALQPWRKRYALLWPHTRLDLFLFASQALRLICTFQLAPYGAEIWKWCLVYSPAPREWLSESCADNRRVGACCNHVAFAVYFIWFQYFDPFLCAHFFDGLCSAHLLPPKAGYVCRVSSSFVCSLSKDCTCKSGV